MAILARCSMEQRYASYAFGLMCPSWVEYQAILLPRQHGMVRLLDDLDRAIAKPLELLWDQSRIGGKAEKAGAGARWHSLDYRITSVRDDHTTCMFKLIFDIVDIFTQFASRGVLHPSLR